MPYQIEVKIYDKTTKQNTWEAIRPTGGRPYVFDTLEEASRIKNMCYPQQTIEEVDRKSVV